MKPDLRDPFAQIAQHYMHHKGLDLEPFECEVLEGQPCTYFYYDLPEGVLELEVFWDERREEWSVMVTQAPSR